MSHRRKSARPTNKHWRNGPYTYDQLTDVDDVEEEEEGGREGEPGDAGGDQAIEIPPDIFQDFEQLKHATNLDTSTLMRNLLKDYHRVSPNTTWHRPVSEEPEFKSSTPPLVDDKQVMSETFGTRLFDVGIVRRSPAIDTGYVSRDSSVAPEVESGDQPLDLSVVVKSEERETDSQCLQSERTEATYHPKTLLQRSLACADSPQASPGVFVPSAMLSSAMMTTVAAGSQLSQGGLVMASTMSNQCKVVMSSAVPSSGSFTVSGDKNECIMMPMQMSMQLPTVTAVEGGQKFLTGNFSVDANGNQQGNIVAIPILQAVTGPMTSVPMQVTSVSAQPQTSSPSLSQPQLQMQQQQQQPAPVQPHVPARRGRKPGSLNKGNKVPKPAKSTEMKIVAENTMFPGVYTSILKLPWSRRSRTKAQPQPPPPPPPPKQSMTILPVTSQEIPEASAATTATTSQPATTQSVMMVYPNATISALGKPVRKRGRPPKLPVLSHLLAEKKPKRDNAQTTVATSLSSQSASISADGSMLSILSTHSIGADTLPDDEKLKKLQLLNSSDQQVLSYQAPVPELQRTEPNGSAKEANGSMFQEMLLSSKSLINIKPRKRQSSNIIKSGENFICTSFRIRPRASRHKAQPKPPVLIDTQLPVQATPVQMVSNVNNLPSTGDTEPPSSAAPVESSTDTNNLSPTSTVDDSPLSKNMFHELYHCKVCNEIVPAEDKQTHKQQHVPVKFFCLTCGQEYYSFLQGKDGDDPEAPQSFQCERCSENFNESSESLESSFDLKLSENRCEDCDEDFKCFSDFREHKREVHGEGETELKSFSCDECDKLFLSEKTYLSHKEKHKTSLRCVLDDCPVLSADEAQLETHVKECHNKKEYPCVYDDCKKKFMKKFHLQEHIRVKHFNIRAYRCSWPGCYKEFAAERHLKVHLLIHKDEKPLKCDFCDYRCRQRNAMNWHMRKHPEAPYRYRKFSMLGGGDD